MASPFEHLRDFIRKRMRMAHIYQPVMIKELLKSGGKASIRDIAAAFLSRDESQLEYYEQITKDMPGKVLGKHGIVERNGEEYCLSVDPSSLSSEERDELVRLCDEAISAYLQKRGKAVFDHRRAVLGYLSGSLRYEVLKRAGFRCELCGISADERAIEVDHIVPRKRGGEDDPTNLQALCFKCNANKGARDDADWPPTRTVLPASPENRYHVPQIRGSSGESRINRIPRSPCGSIRADRKCKAARILPAWLTI